PSWHPMLAGIGTAVFFLALTVKWTIPSLIGAVFALVSILRWLWESDPAPSGKLHDIGGNIQLPDYMSGSRSHSWWSMVVLMLVDGSIFACLIFTFYYLWTISQSGFPPTGLELPLVVPSLLAIIAWVASAGVVAFAERSLSTTRSFSAALLSAMALLWSAFAFSLYALLETNLRPQMHGFASTSYTMVLWQGLHVVVLTLMGGYTLARAWAGMIDAKRRNVFDNTRIMWYYCAAQGVLALVVLHSPRFAS
ncbi:MAG: cytochrome ubiquinol oxidase subunit I, partial [Steroidobacter sp.]